MPSLGPFDRRSVRTRCVACTRRKIKCEGEPPCMYCRRKKQKCVAQAAVPKTKAVFINIGVEPAASLQVVIRKSPPSPTPISAPPPNVSLDKPTIFLKHFFSEFLAANDFGAALDYDTIITQFQRAPSLYQASVAIGALDLSNNLRQTPAERQKARIGALSAYRTSIISFQNDIDNGALKPNDCTLWTTFFLGLFELMYDETGEGFVKHFLHGTSKLLQLRGPEAHLKGAGRSFFLTVRVFEICRALIYSNYSEPTFLSRPCWRELTRRIWDESEDWHPKEDLFDLMISCSSLSERVFDALKTDPLSLPIDMNDILKGLASEGLQLRTALTDWHETFQRWIIDSIDPKEICQSILASLYFHGISIFLSGIFDYRPGFNHLLAPRLPQAEIQHHVHSILLETEMALRTTKLGGVVYFFPLSVAGARVESREQGERIVAMLNQISRRSFVVAGAFISDLRVRWLEMGL